MYDTSLAWITEIIDNLEAEANEAIEPPWANGAKILVEGIDASAIDEARLDFGPRHIVVRSQDEPLVLAAFSSLPCRSRPRLKPNCGRIERPGDGDLSLLAGSSIGHTSFPLNESEDFVARSSWLENDVAEGAVGTSSLLDNNVGEGALVTEASVPLGELI